MSEKKDIEVIEYVGAEYSRAYGNHVMGCQRHKRDVVLTAMARDADNKSTIVDTFLTNDEAFKLANDLLGIISKNKDVNFNVLIEGLK